MGDFGEPQIGPLVQYSIYIIDNGIEDSATAYSSINRFDHDKLG